MLIRSNCGKRSTSRRSTVDLPAPDGPERMISLPTEGLSLMARGGRGSGEGGRREYELIPPFPRPHSPFLPILDLLANSPQGALDLHHVARAFGVVRFRADRVHLAAHLLHDEFQLAARTVGKLQGVGGLLQGAPQ